MKFKGTNIEPVICVCHPDLCSDIEIYSPVSLGKSDSESDGTNLKEKDNIRPIVAEVPESKADESQVLNLKEKLSFVEFREGRPNIQEIIANEVNECSANIVFATCASPCMVDDARVAVVDIMKNVQTKRIDLFEVIEGW